MLIKVLFWEAMPRSPVYKALSSLPLDFGLVKSEVFFWVDHVCPMKSIGYRICHHNTPRALA